MIEIRSGHRFRVHCSSFDAVRSPNASCSNTVATLLQSPMTMRFLANSNGMHNEESEFHWQWWKATLHNPFDR